MPDTLEEILGELNLVLGVVGSFACSSEGDPLVSLPSRFFDRRALSLVGHVATQTIGGLRSVQAASAMQLDLAYANWHVLVKLFRDGCLCVVCLPDVNRPMLRMAADLAARQLSATLK